MGTILRFPVRLAVFVFGSTLLLSVLFLRIVVAGAGAMAKALKVLFSEAKEDPCLMN